MYGSKAGRLPVIFLGGIFSPGQTEYVLEHSRGSIQNAADAFQKNILRGLLESGEVDLSVVNLPFIGSYPKLFLVPNFPGTREQLQGDVQLVGMPFVLRTPWKAFSRFSAAAKGLSQVDTQRGSVILAYSAHLPFLAAALLQRFRKRDTRVCLVLPDLPEFMDERGRFYAIAKALESRVFRLLAKQLDGFVVLTKAMAEQLQLNETRFVVVEGIAAASDAPHIGQREAEKRVFLYTGTLASRYGILELVESFSAVEGKQAELWIAGEGDAKERIVEAAAGDTRIKYLGQVSRSEALRLQAKASVLVNPRRPEGKFTKYSFPSKTMEYMASGRPVLMFKLPGMPEEYVPHFIDPGTDHPDAMRQAIARLIAADATALTKFGSDARHFVLTQKNAQAQCRKMLKLLNAIRSA